MPGADDKFQMEIGHVLFLDIVGYSKLLIDEQKERLSQLNEIVLATSVVREADQEKLVRLPTGDGMALVFRQSPEEPVQCALEIAEALRRHPELTVRMGIHSGPVSEVTDVSGRTNIAGAGINMAQRVMDCGDAGHILLSQRVADDLMQYREWAPRLHDLGEFEVKHGVRLHLVNLYAEPLGNSVPPAKLQPRSPVTPGIEQRSERTSYGWVLAVVVAALVLAGSVYYLIHRGRDKNAAPAERTTQAVDRRIETQPATGAQTKLPAATGAAELSAPGGEDILAGENGGKVVASSSATWAGTIDGKEDQIYWFNPNDEGVYTFKGRATARFSRFAVFIPETDSHNLKSFELLAGDESRFGHFRSLGKFTTQNLRDPSHDGYQEFSFAPVTAKFFKVRLLAPFDKDDKRIELYEFKLFGEIVGPVDEPTPQADARINLLSPDNGGGVALAPNENWKQTIDDREDQVYWFEPHEEAVFQFRNGTPAQFDCFSVLIPETDEHNLAEFELLVGNDKPDGQFRSVGRFKTHNARVPPDGYQQFKFAPQTARYLKVRVLAPHSSADPRIQLYEFRLLGPAQ